MDPQGLGFGLSLGVGEGLELRLGKYRNDIYNYNSIITRLTICQ
jgi:hypothetical protein